MSRRKAGQARDERVLLRKRQRWLDKRFGVYIEPLGIFHASYEGPHWIWVTCGRCSDDYRMATGMWYAFDEETSAGLTFRAGPCPSCYLEEGVVAWGEPHLTTMTQEGMATTGATPYIAATMLEAVLQSLKSGEMEVTEAAQELREAGGPLTRVADWLESRPVTVQLAIGVITTVAAVAGPQLASRPPDDEPGIKDQQVVEIIDTVLDHYDRTHPDLASQPKEVAPSGEPANTSRRGTEGCEPSSKASP